MLIIKSILNKSIFNFIQNMSIFTQKLNPITGALEWIVQNEDYDYHQEVARSSYADMLHDTERNAKYEAAVKVAIDHVHSKGKKANVLDIGAGTGLLSMFAVRHGADSVVACEAFTPMSQCAVKIIELNGFSDKIKIIPKPSTELTVGEGCDIELKPNILVTEVFDTELIGEGALNTFKQAHDELLEKDCIVIPNSAVMFAQIVESPLIQNWNLLKDIYNEDGLILLRVPEKIKECPGAPSVHDIQMSQLPLELFNAIVPPQVVFEFDWSGKTPLQYERSNVKTFKVERDGTAQGVFMWWELAMDINNEIILSCAPYWAHPDYKASGNKKVPWRDHWMQAVYYLPTEVKVWKNEEIHLLSCHDEFSIWFSLKKDISAITEADYIRPFCYCNLHGTYSRTRIGQLNDGIRSKKFISLLERNITHESIVLILSHGFYHGLTAAKLGAKKVVCVEPSTLSRSLIKSFIKYNDLDNVEVIESVKDLQQLDDGLKFNLVFGEPYFETSIVPWDNLLFIYLLGDFQKFCSDDVKVFPKQAVIMGMAVEFSDLYKIRAPLGVCQNFEMKPFDDLIQVSSTISDENVEAQPLWEYPCRALSQPVAIATLQMEKVDSGVVETTGNFNLTGHGNCNGVTLWVDWLFDETCTVSTGPTAPVEVGESVNWNMHVRQGVQLINNRNFEGQIDYIFKFEYKTGNISIYYPTRGNDDDEL